MFSHQTKDYVCPFCKFINGTETKYNLQQDIVYQNKFTTALISPHWWINNAGHVLVVPNKHYENIYNIPDKQIAEVHKTTKKIAIAIRSTYGCDGTSTRQHNEPAGNQEVWHFHVHVLPRYEEDNLYYNYDKISFADAKARKVYAEKLRKYLSEDMN